MAAKDPQGTAGIEIRWVREIKKRWAEYTKVTIAELRRANAEAKIINSEPVAYNASRMRQYNEFIRLQIDEILLGAQVGAIGVDESWMHKYQLDSYQLSLDRFQAELVLQGASIVPTAAEAQAALFLQPLAAIPSLGGQINPNVIAPIHRDALEFLFTRSLESLEGWTDNLARETRQITMDSITQGRGINETVRELQRRIDVSRSRAELIARTEVSQAFQHASNNEAIRASEALGEPILLRWITARDVKVRHLHSRWHGQLSNVKENARRISLSAFNCRCVQVPVIAEANTAAKNRKFESQRTALLALENS